MKSIFNKFQVVSLLALSASLALLPCSAVNVSASALKAGDIIYADSGNAIDGGFIIKVDPNSGQQTVIASGGNLAGPFDVAIEDNGQIIASDQGRLVRIDPETGQQTVLADNSRGTLGYALGIALDRHGDVLVANLKAIVRVDPATGQIQQVCSGGHFLYPLGVAVAQSGELFVLNRAFPSEIIRVNPRNGSQRVISRGGYLKSPQAIALNGNDLYVTDVATSDGNFGVGRVILVDARVGTQTVLSEGGHLVGPVGIAVDESGQIIVGDPYTINPESRDLYDGGIIKIDPATGAQNLIARGRGSFLNPRGVTVVRSLSRERNQEH